MKIIQLHNQIIPNGETLIPLLYWAYLRRENEAGQWANDRSVAKANVFVFTLTIQPYICLSSGPKQIYNLSLIIHTEKLL